MKNKTTVQVISDKVTAIIPETDEYIEHTIIINSVEGGITINAAGESVWIPSYALKDVFKEAIKLNQPHSI